MGERLKAQGFHYFVVRDLETFQGLVDMYFTPLPGAPVTPAAVADAQLINLVKLQQRAEVAQRGMLEAQQAAREAAAEAQQLRARCEKLEEDTARRSERPWPLPMHRPAPWPAPQHMREVIVLD
eukprot:7390116-Prymnesium_polylepis.1